MNRRPLRHAVVAASLLAAVAGVVALPGSATAAIAAPAAVSAATAGTHAAPARSTATAATASYAQEVTTPCSATTGQVTIALGGNLISNPGAEYTGAVAATSPVTETYPDCWTVASPDAAAGAIMTAISYASYDKYTGTTVTAPPDSGGNFFDGGYGVTTQGDSAVAFQTIDLSSLDAAGQPFGLSAWLGGYLTDADDGTVSATFENAAGDVLAVSSLDPVTEADRSGLAAYQYRQATGVVPAGTAQALITIQLNNLHGGSGVAAWADNLDFTVGASAAAVQSQLLSGSGLANTATGSCSAATGQATVALDADLISNPGAEYTGTEVLASPWTESDLDCWTTASPEASASAALTAVPYAGYDSANGVTVGAPTADPGSNFFDGGLGVTEGNSTYAFQTIDLSTLKVSGKRYELSGWLGGYKTDSDPATVTAVFEGANGQDLGTAVIGPVTEADRDGTAELLGQAAEGTVPAGTRQVFVTLRMTNTHGGTGIAAFADNLDLTIGPDLPAPPAAPTVTEPVTARSWYTYTQGELNAPATTQISTPTQLIVNPSWSDLTFTGEPGVLLYVAGYDQYGNRLYETGWVPFTSSYTYAIEPDVYSVRYALEYTDGAAITPSDRASWTTITETTNPAPADPFPAPAANPSPTDADFYGPYVSGTLDDSTGAAESSDAWFRLATPAAINPSWKSLSFTGASDLDIEVFAYNKHGQFLAEDSAGPQGGERPLGTPYIYPVPANTAYISYAVSYADGADIDPASQSSWVTVTVPALTPDNDYTIRDQAITPDFTIPGVEDEQGGNFVDGDLWTAIVPSDDEHEETDGVMNVYSIDYADRTSTLIHQFTFNFGHMNSFSWNRANDDLIFGNGGDSWTLPSQFYVVDESKINLDGANTLASTDAITYKVPVTLGWKVNVIWTSQPNVAVLIADDTSRMYKIQLGTGTQDFGYGTYTAAAAGQYNGTYKILDTYQMGNLYYFMNGAAWVNGKLIMVLSEGYRAMAVVTLGNDDRLSYQVIRDPTTVQPVWETPFYDPATGYFGAVNAETSGSQVEAYFWKDTNWTFTDQSVTSVSVTPRTATVRQGGTQPFTARVTGDDNPAQTVTWSVSGNTSTATTISSTGVLTIGTDETATRLTITATSTVNPAKSGTATVLLPPASTQ